LTPISEIAQAMVALLGCLPKGIIAMVASTTWTIANLSAMMARALATIDRALIVLRRTPRTLPFLNIKAIASSLFMATTEEAPR